MKAKIGIVRGATESEVLSKKFNLYIGISLGNKWFTKENIKESIIWCLKYSKSKVVVLVADTLHAINYEVRNKLDFQRAKEKSLKEGDKYIKIIKEIISELPETQKENVIIAMWDDVFKDLFNKKYSHYFFDEFKTNEKFKNEIIKIIQGFIKNESKRFSEKDVLKLCDYILTELPEILHGFEYKGIKYNAYTYPHDGSLTRFVEKIQKRKIFPHVKDELKKIDNVFIELKVV